jgi:Mg2+/citrate symporter
MVDVFGAVLTVVVLLAVAVFILVFERRRAKQIEHDLRHQHHERSDETERPPGRE